MKKIRCTVQDKGRECVQDNILTESILNRSNTCSMWHVSDTAALYKLIGYLKYINRESGHVFFRGQNKLYLEYGFQPSAYRKRSNKTQSEIDAEIVESIRKFDEVCDEDWCHVRKTFEDDSKYVVEAAMQHYGAKTRFLDLVDNAETALWFACHTCDGYCYKESKEEYSYIFVVGVEGKVLSNTGLTITENGILVDLRAALPSTFLRPHAQQAFGFAMLQEGSFAKDYFDCVLGIIRMETSTCLKWLGNGLLATAESMFPKDDSFIGLLLEKKEKLDRLGLKVGEFYSERAT